MRETMIAVPEAPVSFDEFDEMNDPRTDQTDFGELAEKAISRRGFLGRGVAFSAAAFVMGATGLAPLSARAAARRIGFEPVEANSLDTVTVPRGYSWHVVAKWGDPMWSNSMAFDQGTRGSGASQELAFGDNNDGMSLFADGARSVLAVNNEYVNRNIIYGGAGTGKPENADDVRKGKAGHGVSIVEIVQIGGRWSIVINSPYNRRITADTPMQITGPARGHDRMKTAADPTGTGSKGTWNNCGNGRTPWGTYLACEENFNGYFSSSDPGLKVGAEFKRYGVGLGDRGYAWATVDERFDISKHPNEPNRAGYIVEIDPLDPTSTPKKRTALGRVKHENAEVVLAANGQVVVYMGDDERGEFLYKFVSDGRYVEGGGNEDLLENGKLFAAKFAGGGRGEWVELTPASTGMASQAELCIHTRQAASAVRATTMDRPEWVAANPKKAEVYCCLTNNKNRGSSPMPAAMRLRSAGPIRARRTSTARSCVGRRTEATISSTVLPGTCLWSPAIRRSMTTTRRARPMSTRTTCSTRPTASPSTATACCGSRLTATTPTAEISKARATTRCWPAIPRPARSGVSWSGRGSARSPASLGAPTARPCSSVSSTRAI